MRQENESPRLVQFHLEGPPFKSLQSSSLRILSLKAALLLALASVKRVGDLQALFVNPVCLDFGPNDSKVVLKPKLGYVPKMLSTPFRAQVITLSAFSPLTGSQESLICPVRALRIYIERSASYRKSEQLFVCFGNHAKGGPVTKQRISRWLVNAITLAYFSSGLQCPIGVRAHSTRGINSSWVQWGVHFRHLWGGWLVLVVHICNALQPGCSRLAGQSPFCLSSNLSGSLDQHCSSTFLLGLSITIWMPGVTSGPHPGQGWPSRLTLCLVYSIDSPGPNPTWVLVSSRSKS